MVEANDCSLSRNCYEFNLCEPLNSETSILMDDELALAVCVFFSRKMKIFLVFLPLLWSAIICFYRITQILLNKRNSRWRDLLHNIWMWDISFSHPWSKISCSSRSHPQKMNHMQQEEIKKNCERNKRNELL